MEFSVQFGRFVATYYVFVEEGEIECAHGGELSEPIHPNHFVIEVRLCRLPRLLWNPADNVLDCPHALAFTFL